MSLPPPTPAQARILWSAVTAVSLALLAGVLVLLVWGAGQLLELLGPVLWPLAVAGAVAYLLDPVVDRLVDWKVPRPRAIALVFAGALALVAGLLGSVVPQAVGEARQFATRVPGYARRLQARTEAWVRQPPALLQKVLDLRPNPADAPPAETAVSPEVPGSPAPGPGVAGAGAGAGAGGTASSGTELPGWLSPDAVRSATVWIGQSLPVVGTWLFGQVSRVGSWLAVLAGLGLVPVYAFYFLLEKRGIERGWADYLPLRDSRLKDELVFCLRAINGYLIVFFRGQVLVALGDGVLYTAGFLVIGLPYAFLLGVMATALTLIPFVGAMATTAAALGIALATGGSWHLPAGVLAVVAVVQAIEGLVLSPKILGDRVGLHPLAIIVAVMAGTSL
ncbi:MAG: AI-2E family transporter, partial [Verrucomicrobiota bacterium]